MVVLFCGGCFAACSVTPEPSVAPSIATQPSPAVTDVGWTRVTLPNSGQQSWVAAAVAVPGGLVLVGEVDGRPAAWSSSDFTSWSAELLAGRGPLPFDATPYRDGVLAIGAGENGNCAHPAGEDTWVRRIGAGWVEAIHQDVFCAGGSPSLAVAGDRAVVVGTGSGDQAFAWTSDDGLTWTAARGPFPEEPPYAVISRGGIGFVAISQAYGSGLPWVGRSVDGIAWTFDRLAIPAGSRPVALVQGGGRTLAVFGRDNGGIVGLLSDDATHWQPTDLGVLSMAGAARVSGMALGGAFAAFGGGPKPSVLISPDGETWQSIALPALPSGWVPGPIVLGSNAVVLVVNPDDNGGQVQVWTEPSKGIVP